MNRTIALAAIALTLTACASNPQRLAPADPNAPTDQGRAGLALFQLFGGVLNAPVHTHRYESGPYKWTCTSTPSSTSCTEPRK